MWWEQTKRGYIRWDLLLDRKKEGSVRWGTSYIRKKPREKKKNGGATDFVLRGMEKGEEKHEKNSQQNKVKKGGGRLKKKTGGVFFFPNGQTRRGKLTIPEIKRGKGPCRKKPKPRLATSPDT